MFIYKFKMCEREEAEKVLQSRDLDSLERLKSISPETLQHYRDIVGEEWYKYHMESLPFETKSLSLNNPIINDIVYTILNKEQRSVFKDLHTAISDSYGSGNQLCVTSPKILLLDSPSRTGKTFLLMLLSLTLNGQMISIEYSRELAYKMKRYSNVKSYNNYKFLMNTTSCSLDEAKNMFPEYCDDSVQIITEIANKYQDKAIAAGQVDSDIRQPQVLILNEYTRFSPWFLTFLMMYAYEKRINLLYVGDQDMLNPVDETRFHVANNYTLVSSIADRVFSMSKQVGIEDERLNSLVSTFKRELKGSHVVPMSFKYAYLVYRTFPEKFFLPEDFKNNLFLAHYHKQISGRTRRFLDHLRSVDPEGRNSHIACYYVGTETKTTKSISRGGSYNKFVPFLLLCKGGRYFYKDKDKDLTRTVVRYLDRDENVLTMIDEKNDRKFQLNYVNLTHSRYLRDELIVFLWNKAGINYHDWLKTYLLTEEEKKSNSRDNAFLITERKKDNHWIYPFLQTEDGKKSSIWNYPLTAYSSTYHAAQSLEISSDETIELDINAREANSIYVGLTRLNNSSQLKKIHSELLLSLIHTHYFDDKYYYKVNPSTYKNFCDRLEDETRTYYENKVSTESHRIVYSPDLVIDKSAFTTIDDPGDFMNSMNCRIERHLLDEKKPATAETQLIDYCISLKDEYTKEGAAAGTADKNKPFTDKQ